MKYPEKPGTTTDPAEALSHEAGRAEELTDLLLFKLKEAYEGDKKPDPNCIVQVEFYKEDEGARIRRGNTIKGDD